jgi:adenylate cyclase
VRFRITIVLMVAIGGLTAIAVGTVLFVSVSTSIRNTLELMRNRAELTISAVERGVFDHMEPARDLIADLSRRVTEGKLDISDRSSVAEVLSGALASAPQIGGVVVWQASGSGLWVDRHSDGIHVETEPSPDRAELVDFLSRAEKMKGVQWGAPYYREGATYITIASPLFRDGAYVGAIAAGVSVVALSNFVRHELTNSAVTAFVLYGPDKVLAHPALLDPEYSGLLSAKMPLLSVDAIGDPVLAKFPSLPIADLPSQDDFQVRDTGERGTGEVILSRSTDAFGSVPWQIGVHIPVADVNQQFRRLAVSIAVSLGLFLAALVAAIILARRIARPIRAVSAAASKIEHLDLDSIEPLARSRIRELDEQAQSFNRMVNALRWFRAYVPHQLVRRLINTAGGPAAEVREAELTVMFTDISGFTPLSESLPPGEVAEMLNRHFEMLISCIEAEGGTVDKFIGDAAMAFWGAPEDAPDHAARACRAALGIARALEASAAAGETSIRMKIALHTGPLIVGNIGAQSRMNYTVIGDTVNVCARIEKLCGEYAQDGTATILVSGDVVAAAGDGFRFEPIGDRQVKGRAQSIAIWRLVGETAAQTA